MLDIFNRKKVAELEKKLAASEKNRNDLLCQVASYKKRFEELGEFEESIPEDCVRGPWCEACEFVKTFHVTRYYGFGHSQIETAYICGKGKSCNNFVQKKYEEE